MFAQVAFNRPIPNLFTYSSAAPITAGVRVEVPFGASNALTTGVVMEVSDTLPTSAKGFDIKPISKVLDFAPLISDELLELAKFLSSYYLCSIGEAIFTIIPSGKEPKRKKKDPAPLNSTTSTATADANTAAALENNKNTLPNSPIPFTLSDEQNAAIRDILSTVGNYCLHYIFGVTGSGKTQVYLQIAKELLSRGKSVIYLVPEINLTVQLLNLLKRKFGTSIALLHSKLTPARRLKEWKRVLSGEPLIITGARSAVFAPVRNLGAIIIDEEHDTSYKSDDTPRYHARQVAFYRAKNSNCPVIMGSATPSLESYYLMESGKIARHALTKRLAGGAQPKINIIDCSNMETGGCISAPLEAAIKETLLSHKQVILFLNRRGFSRFLRCQSCTYEFYCPNCSLPMTYHKESGILLCHYCGKKFVRPTRCPKCGSYEITTKGFGTEFIDEEVRGKFPTARAIRVDSDSLKKKGAAEEIFNAFERGDYDIMTGTQMVAKGLNFPNVQLSAIIDADAPLHSADFRSEERTFSIITQVAGRAGRFAAGARVFIQTMSPNDRAIHYAALSNLKDFYDSETLIRRDQNFPPFSRLLRLVFRSTDKNKVQAAIKDAAAILKKYIDKTSPAINGAKNPLDTLQNNINAAPNTSNTSRTNTSGAIKVLGPAPCPISRLKKYYRANILLLGDITAILHTARYLQNNYKCDKNVYIEYDTDPVNMS